MIIQPHLEPHEVEQYDIVYEGFFPRTISINRSLGDEVDETTHPGLAVIFKIMPKASTIDPEVKVPGETITVFMDKVLEITKRTILVMPVNPEIAEQFRKSLHKLSSTLQ